MDLLLGSVTEGLLGNGERDISVAGDAQIEDFSLVRSRGSEGADNDRGGNRLGRREELVGEIFLGLGTSVVYAAIAQHYTPGSDCLFRCP